MSRIGKFIESRSVLIRGRGLRIGNEERLLMDFFLPNDENILNSDCADGCTML